MRRRMSAFKAALLPVTTKRGLKGMPSIHLVAPKSRPERVIAVNAASRAGPPMADPVAVLSKRTILVPCTAMARVHLSISSSLDG